MIISHSAAAAAAEGEGDAGEAGEVEAVESGGDEAVGEVERAVEAAVRL